MLSRIGYALLNFGAIALMASAFFLIAHPSLWPRILSQPAAVYAVNPAPASTAAASATSQLPATTTTAASNAPAKKPTASTVAAVKKPVKPVPKPESAESAKAPGTPEVTRIENPYSFPPQSFSSVNDEARAALVNILCEPRGGSFRPVSGSGVLIDPRGVILTNAHVAQYVLLASDRRIDLSCTIRAGSPARLRWNVEVLYIPSVWVKEHAADITTQRPLGTGEHDYALLRITGPVNPESADARLEAPSLPVDTREAIGFIDDPVLVAGYPAEFVGGIVTQLNLYPASSVTTIKELLTFGVKTIDLVSVGGVIEAQSGSSGGALVNAWGRLIGIISTTSEGATTDQRDLRAITLSYIDRDISAQTGSDLQTMLSGDIAIKAASFNSDTAPALIQLIVEKLEHRSS